MNRLVLFNLFIGCADTVRGALIKCFREEKLTALCGKLCFLGVANPIHSCGRLCLHYPSDLGAFGKKSVSCSSNTLGRFS